ncbi:cytidylyltransferase domain-containing protein [Butyrivibrio fibrisolvens]|uniref:acylneuraminate cytidylyltransferase family protein n=1 Tax=Butyrivibrio fibrisolvens TaxID=831 RepID=UPI00040F7BA7|nr:acylneuraminate cytidylyltransferase family protein [Butyrivibrio fibrisolvens]
MYKDETIIAIIPARSGSKGIKDKNIYPINGRPLISYTIDAAKGSRYIDYVMVSTDSKSIADVARNCGADIPFMRPVELALDTSRTVDAIVSALSMLQNLDKSYDILVLLQPTSPLRTAEDIDKAIELFYQEGKKSLLSVSEVNENPVLMRRLNGNEAIPILNVSSTVRRQDFEKFYKVNGAIYINAIPEINENTSFNDNELGYVMDTSHCIDIDTLEDIREAEKNLR